MWNIRTEWHEKECIRVLKLDECTLEMEYSLINFIWDQTGREQSKCFISRIKRNVLVCSFHYRIRNTGLFTLFKVLLHVLRNTHAINILINNLIFRQINTILLKNHVLLMRKCWVDVGSNLKCPCNVRITCKSATLPAKTSTSMYKCDA